MNLTMKNFLLIMIIIGILASARSLMSLVYFEDYLSKSGDMYGGMKNVSTLLMTTVYILGIPFAIKCPKFPFRGSIVYFSVGLLLDSLVMLFFPFSLLLRISGDIIVIITSGFAIFELNRSSKEHQVLQSRKT